LRFLSVLEHEDLIVEARAAAEGVLAADATLRAHGSLRDQLARIERRMLADYIEKA
jgi:hypothetical protein